MTVLNGLVREYCGRQVVNPPACCLLLANVREGSRAGTARGDSGVAVEGRIQDRSTQSVVVMGIQVRALESAELWSQPTS